MSIKWSEDDLKNYNERLRQQRLANRSPSVQAAVAPAHDVPTLKQGNQTPAQTPSESPTHRQPKVKEPPPVKSPPRQAERAAVQPPKKGRYGTQNRTNGAASFTEAKALDAAFARVRPNGDLVASFSQVRIPFARTEKGKLLSLVVDRMDVIESYPDGSCRVRFIDTKAPARGKSKDEAFDTRVAVLKRAFFAVLNIKIFVEIFNVKEHA